MPYPKRKFSHKLEVLEPMIGSLNCFKHVVHDHQRGQEVRKNLSIRFLLLALRNPFERSGLVSRNRVLPLSLVPYLGTADAACLRYSEGQQHKMDHPVESKLRKPVLLGRELQDIETTHRIICCSFLRRSLTPKQWSKCCLTSRSGPGRSRTSRDGAIGGLRGMR